MTPYNPYEQWADGKLKEINAQMTALQAKAQQANAESRIAVEEQIAKLRRQYDDISTQLSKAAGLSQAAFKELKAGTRQAIDDMMAGINRAMSHFEN